MKIEKTLGQVSAIVFADYVLKHYGPMSHLKLQKLLYYSEAYHLAYFENPVLYEDFQAWVHGPVCIEVYHELKGQSVLYTDVGFDGNEDPDKVIDQELTSKQIEHLREVLDVLSTWKDSELETATHRERPWLEARGNIPTSQKHDGVISKVTMMEYYKTELIPK